MKYFNNHFLFSETYIKEYIRQENRKKKEDNNEVESAFQQVKDWNNEFVFGDYSNEHWFAYIDSVLDVLKFPYRKIVGNTRILYANTISESEKPVAICYFVDKEEGITSRKKGKYYAYNALKTAKEYEVNWAMLTNGYQWRIYNTKNVSLYENYLEVDIEESIRNNKKADDAFELFYLFFNVHTYYTKDGELEIEKIKVLSDTKAETIEDALRGKAEEILKELCYGLKENMGKEIYSEKEKKDIYNDAIILLYRLLFFGYAESRGLLPIVENDPEYTDSYRRLCDDAKDIHNVGNVYKIKDGFEFWERLDTQLRLYVDRSYNGGLFHNEDKPILKEHRIANGRLTKCLVELSYNTDKTGKYMEAIEYKDLSVRNLGSIYEGLLEYRLFIAEERMVQKKSKGKVRYLRAADVKLQNSDLRNLIEKGGIYLSQDALERKETGAYYTPEDVVEYIVDNTVGKKLKELKEELLGLKNNLLEQLSYEPLESRKRILQSQIDDITMDFINEKILSLSIIDSAMGSGHFLVNAAYRVANEIVGIICDNAWGNNDIIADIKYWKRKVVENCIYGIDINSLSVALARLSLWLISASNDKALSFIDHHLKEGNSIIGTDRRRIEVKETDIPMFIVSYEEYMRPVLKEYDKLRNIGSATKADVIQQIEVYKDISEDLKIAKKKYDYYLASQYAGGINDQMKYVGLLRSNDILDFQEEDMEPLWEIAREKKFFHWELEFPEVFQKGGFDIVIGNPPYVEVNDDEYNENYKPLNFLSRKCGNLYVYFIEHVKNVCKCNSKVSMITPLAMFCTPRMESIQRLIKERYNSIKISFYDCRPGTIFKNALVFASIFFFENNEVVADKQIFTTRLIKWYSHERRDLFTNIDYTLITDTNIINEYSIPKISDQIENDILKKMRIKAKKLSEFTDNKIKNDVLYGYGGRNWIKAMNYFPQFRKNGLIYNSTGDRFISFRRDINIKWIVSIFNSTIFYWNYLIYSDCRNKTKTSMLDFYIDFDTMNDDIKKSLEVLSDELMNDYKKNSVFKTCNYPTGIVEYYEFYPKRSKHIIDNIDYVLGEYYGLTENEIEYIINYNLKFRMGEDFTEEDE